MKAAAIPRAAKSVRKDTLERSEEHVDHGHELSPTPDAHTVHLTSREREVLALLCEGLSNKLIARRLKISYGTVKVHISNILKALGVSTRLQAVLYARCWNLVHEASIQTLRAQHNRRASHR